MWGSDKGRERWSGACRGNLPDVLYGCYRFRPASMQLAFEPRKKFRNVFGCSPFTRHGFFTWVFCGARTTAAACPVCQQSATGNLNLLKSAHTTFYATASSLWDRQRAKRESGTCRGSLPDRFYGCSPLRPCLNSAETRVGEKFRNVLGSLPFTRYGFF